MEKVSKTKFFCECFFEKCMEWIEFLRNGIVRRDKWVSNLSEHYCIYKDYMCKEFVKDFLDEREKILGNNRYKMFINIIQEKGEPGTVGKVMLYSKDKLIHQATLKVKIMDDNEGNIIFWAFDKNENKKDN